MEICFLFFFLMIRRPPRSTQSRSSAASDVYKRQDQVLGQDDVDVDDARDAGVLAGCRPAHQALDFLAVSYTHLRAHETVLDLVCRLLLEKKKNQLHDITHHCNSTITYNT